MKTTACPYDIAFTVSAKPIQMFCGKWSCSTCAKMNARQWSWRVRLHLSQSGKHWWFITFTLRGSIKDTVAGYKQLPKLWNRMRMAFIRQWRRLLIRCVCVQIGWLRMVCRLFRSLWWHWRVRFPIVGYDLGWEYVAFVEGQPQRYGMPHFHIISSMCAPQRVKDFAMYSGFGFEAKQKRIDSDKAGSYCAKYASKHDPRMPKSLRRVRTSHNWTKLPDRDLEPYIVRSRSESLSAYVCRVSELTGVEHEIIAGLYASELAKIKTS